MAAREPGGGGRAVAFLAGMLLVLIAAAVVYLVYGIGERSRCLHVAINAPSVSRLAPPRLPSPVPGPPHPSGAFAN